MHELEIAYAMASFLQLSKNSVSNRFETLRSRRSAESVGNFIRGNKKPGVKRRAIPSANILGKDLLEARLFSIRYS